MSRSSKLLVIGIGNLYRHDDAAGLIVARCLKEQAISCVEIHEQIGEGTGLMNLWKDAQCVVVVDAVQSGATPGTIHRFSVNQHPLPASIFYDSTHAFGLIEAVELSRALGHFPSNFVIYGVEGENFAAGTGLSSAVLDAVNDLARQLLQELEKM